MLKDYFVDGLVQIAIVLSLLRTDLNNYMNIDYVNSPEVQEIFLGSSAGYTQTNFINNHINSGYGGGNPKAIYNEIHYDSLLQDLRSLRRFSTWHQRSHSARQIATFLVGLNNLPELARASIPETNNAAVHSENIANNDDESEANQNQTENDNVQYEEVLIGVASTSSSLPSVSTSSNIYDINFNDLTREV